MDAATRFREGDWPLDALIEDYAWRGNKDVAWAPEYAPAREKMFRHLDANKVRLGLHVNERNIYDATDPAAIAAQWPKYRSLVEDGVDFWWQDHGERSAARESKSLFGTLWAKVLAENMAKMGKCVPVLGRSAGSGGQRYISPWGGDIGTDFDLLKTDLAFIRDAGLAGYAYAGCDMGGFGSDRSDLVIMRRVAQQFLVFPVTRPHGARSKPPWTVSKAAQDMWRFYSRLRYRLHPYVYSAAIEAARTGRPILAPLVFDHQDDPATYSRDYDFIFGRDLLVAPVVEKAEQREVYLPKGRWIHYWSGETHEGGKTVSVVAPLMGRDGLPLFAREGAILPMMPETGVTPEKAVYPLALDIYPPAQGVSSRLLLDTETPVSPTVATRMSCSSDKDRVVVETDFRNRALTLIIHAKNEPQRVLRGETELVRVESLEAFERAESGWFVGPGLFPGNEALRTINVKVEAGDAPQPVVLKP
jgi:alpha-glucosidase (family GH31 glycosyl hydrolase)